MGTLFNVDNEDSLPDIDIQDESSIRASVGLGLSWTSPFGPIRTDFSVPLAEESFDKTESFRFDFGTRF